MDVADPPSGIVRLAGFSEIVGPGGETEDERLIVPEKVPWLETVMVDETVEPEVVERAEGDPERPKSGFEDDDWCRRQAVIECNSHPLKLCHCSVM